MVITQSSLEALRKGFRAIFLEALQGGTTPLINSFAMETTSTTSEEIYGWLGAVPGMREFLGEAVIRNIVESAFGIKNKPFESTIGVTRENIERDKLGIYRPLFQAMGLAAREHPDELLAETVMAGFDTNCYTGKKFFDADHEPEKGGTKFSNKATKKLSAANFQTARANIKSRKNAKGRPMALGRDLVLVVSPDYEATGRTILVADKVGGGNDNVDKGTARLEVWPRLASNPHNWFLFELGYPLKPFINQVEVPTEFTALDRLTDEQVFLFKRFLYQAYRRGNVGYALPELAYGSTGADAA